MLGMLVVIFRSDRVAGGARITRELDIFFGDVSSKVLRILISGPLDSNTLVIGF